MNKTEILSMLIIAVVSLFLFAGCTSDESLSAPNESSNELQADSYADVPNNPVNTVADEALYKYELCCVCGEHYAHEFWRQLASPFHMEEFMRPMPYIHQRDFLGNYPFRNQGEQRAAVSAFLSDFETVHTITYIHPRLLRHGDVEYDTVILWSHEILRDFYFISIETDDECDNDEWQGLPYGHTEVVKTIDELRQGDAVVLNLLFNASERPAAGLKFTDENGVQRRMWMSIGARYFCHAFYHLWLYDETPWVNIAWD